MVQLYEQAIVRWFPVHQSVLLDVPAMRFAHITGALMSLIVIVTILVLPGAGWRPWQYSVVSRQFPLSGFVQRPNCLSAFERAAVARSRME